jgi:RNA polymerase sigma factor (sigma-70 family)
MTKVIDHLRGAALVAGDSDLTDGQLLDCFISRRDEAAVAAIVRRHGPMVWGVCRRMLRDYHDAEDAFQATFLVLVRKATSIVRKEMVGSWLYGVAHQTARKARATTAKRQAREKHVSELPEPAVMPEPGPRQDLGHLLDQELTRLPDKYRIAVILCDLQGKPRKQVAGQLKIPEGTLSSRLTTARTMLAKRLARHGLPVSAGALVVVMSHRAAAACVPASVVTSTIKTATIVAAGTPAAGVASINVAALTEGVLKSMLVAKLKLATVLLVAVSTIGLSTAVILYAAPASDQDSATYHVATTTTDGERVVQHGKTLKTDAAGKSKADAQKSSPSDPFRGKALDDDAEKRKTTEKPVEGPPNTKLRALLKERLDSARRGIDG